MAKTVAGGEHLTLGGLEIDVVFTPGHSPGHVTYAVTGANATGLFSGDVLFEGSVGRVDLPGGDCTDRPGDRRAAAALRMPGRSP